MPIYVLNKHKQDTDSNPNHYLCNMNRIAIILFLLLSVLSLQAQKLVHFIDAELESNVAYVVVADEEKIIGKANIDGVIMIQPHKGKLIFSHDNYERVEMEYDQLPEVIRLERRTYMLDGVEVISKGKSQMDKNAHIWEKDKVGDQLRSAGSGNGNLLAPVNKLLNGRKTRKQRKLERLKEVLDQLEDPKATEQEQKQ